MRTRDVSSALLLGFLACSAPPTVAAGSDDADRQVRPLTTSTDHTLEPGRYTRDGFAPYLDFEVGDGWYAVQDVPGFFDVQRDPGTPDVIAVQFARPVDARTADEAVASLRGREGLVVGDPSPVRVAGRAGTRVLVDHWSSDIAVERFIEVFRVAPGPLSIAGGRRLQIIFVDTSDGLLAVLLGGSVRRWDEALRAAEPLLASIEIGRPR